MKIVHTGDWHVGKTIRGKHRGNEYRAILDELAEFIEKENIEVLLVAGDLFDSPSPSAEAADIVYNFFHRISFLNVHSLVIAGNHDSGLRFEAIANIMALANVKMIGMYQKETPQKYVTSIVSRNNKEKITVGLVPFISERFFIRATDIVEQEQEKITHRYSHGMGQLLKEVSNLFPKDSTNIMMGHLLMHGAKPGGGERRLYLGDNYAVHPAVIPKNIDYVALAHVHMYQTIEGSCPIYYCGSPMQMDFGEVDHEKGFLVMELKNNVLSTPQFIPFRNGLRLCSITGTVEEIEDILTAQKELQDCHLKITITTDNTSSSLGLSHKIKQLFPNTVDIRKEFIGKKEQNIIKKNNPQWLPDLYREFHNNHYDCAANPIVLNEFAKLHEECILEEEDKL